MSCRELREIAKKIPKSVLLLGHERHHRLDDSRACGVRRSKCAWVLSWSRHSLVQKLVRQVGWGMDIAQRRNDFLPP